MVKLRLDGRKIMEDVCVIELDIIQDGNDRPVMHHLGALIEECCVVLVRLDDKVSSLSQSCGCAEVHGHAADEEAGRQPSLFEYPG